MSLVTFIYVGQFMRPSLVIKAPYGGMTPYRQQCINIGKVNSRPFAGRNVLKVTARPGDAFSISLNRSAAHATACEADYSANAMLFISSALPNNQCTFGTGVPQLYLTKSALRRVFID